MNDYPSIFVIVPGYNEARVIRSTAEKLLGKNYRVVIVDDASTDDTKKVLHKLPIHYIRHQSNLGQGAALQTGIDFALRNNAEYIVSFDADGQHDVEDIARMFETLHQEKADIVFGSRFLPGSSSNVHMSRKWVLKTARFINFLVSGILLSDANNGLRLMTGKAAQQLKITENRSSHNAQVQNVVKNSKLKYAECPVHVSYTEYSKKKGLRNINSVRILYDLILFKIFR